MHSQSLQQVAGLARRSEFVYVSTLQEEGFPETRIMFNPLNLRGRYYHGLKVLTFDAGTAR